MENIKICTDRSELLEIPECVPQAASKIDIKAELNRLEAQQTAKEIAGKSIGRFGLFYITLIVVIGVLANLELA